MDNIEQKKDYRVEIKVKNNNILKVIEAAGYKTVGEFCRVNNKLSLTSVIGEYVNLKKSPLNRKGEFHDHIYEICDILNCSPSELFTEDQTNLCLDKNKKTIEVSEAEVKFQLENIKENLALEDQMALNRLPSIVNSSLETLTPRERKVIEMRFGLNGHYIHTLEALSNVFGVNKERIRQIEAKALRKLRHPSRSKLLLEYTN